MIENSIICDIYNSDQNRVSTGSFAAVAATWGYSGFSTGNLGVSAAGWLLYDRRSSPEVVFFGILKLACGAVFRGSQEG